MDNNDGSEGPEGNNPFGPVIYAYTRAQALADGVLVDVSNAAVEAGFKVPVALTRAAWDDCVEWNDEDTRRQTPQNASGRLWMCCGWAMSPSPAACACRNQAARRSGFRPCSTSCIACRAVAMPCGRAR